MFFERECICNTWERCFWQPQRANCLLLCFRDSKNRASLPELVNCQLAVLVPTSSRNQCALPSQKFQPGSNWSRQCTQFRIKSVSEITYANLGDIVSVVGVPTTDGYGSLCLHPLTPSPPKSAMSPLLQY